MAKVSAIRWCWYNSSYFDSGGSRSRCYISISHQDICVISHATFNDCGSLLLLCWYDFKPKQYWEFERMRRIIVFIARPPVYFYSAHDAFARALLAAYERWALGSENQLHSNNHDRRGFSAKSVVIAGHPPRSICLPIYHAIRPIMLHQCSASRITHISHRPIRLLSLS